ncbi:MAG TPA: glycosyltransferase [Longimicrobium sp.]|nr:glycosyltransferase [Longimicrobium sp.]
MRQPDTCCSWSVVVPIHNGSRHLGLFWESLKRAITPHTEVLLVDDGSSEDILAAMPGAASHPAVRVFRHRQARGFASAVNRGLTECSGRVIFILNSDLILEPRCLQSLAATLARDPGVGIVGATLSFPQTGGIQHAGIAFSETNHCHVFAHLPADHRLVSGPRQVQGIAFAACALRRAVVETVGLLNDGYFNSYEDFDYCFRVVAAGWTLQVDPGARGQHWERQSGPIRAVLRKDNVARLWRDWGSRIVPDLGRYVGESWADASAADPRLLEPEYTLVTLARNRMAADVLATIDAGIVPVRVGERWDFSQRGSRHTELWLPLVLPVHASRHPRPFLYLVDSFTDLRENHYWFALRRAVVEHEIVFDTCGNVLPALRMGA